MKFTPAILFSFLFFSLSAQLRIDPDFYLITKQKEFRNGTYFTPDFSNTDSIFLKEIATNKVCQMTWCRWTFIIEGETFKEKDMERVGIYLSRLKAKDKIIMEKLVLLPDCFAPPETIIIGIL